MTNKPQNVVEHEHFNVHTSEEIGADDSLDIKRYDACLLADGTAGVWAVEVDEWIRCDNYAAAQACARICRSMERTRILMNS